MIAAGRRSNTFSTAASISSCGTWFVPNVSIMIETFGTNHVPQEEIEAAVEKVFDLRPAAIIDALDLRRPIYRKTAAYGHFGRELPEFTWEHTNKVEDLKAACPSLS